MPKESQPEKQSESWNELVILTKNELKNFSVIFVIFASSNIKTHIF